MKDKLIGITTDQDIMDWKRQEGQGTACWFPLLCSTLIMNIFSGTSGFIRSHFMY